MPIGAGKYKQDQGDVLVSEDNPLSVAEQGGGTAICYIPDNKMRDLATITSGKQASSLLGQKRLKTDKKISELDELITNATQDSVNPALIIAIWGQESGFSDADKKVFGVLRAKTGFYNQLNASVNTINKHLKVAERGTRKISDPKYGAYTAQSEFDYVMTKYTPVYNPGFGNDPNRTNLISFLKKLIPTDLVCNQSTATNAPTTTDQSKLAKQGICPADICKQLPMKITKAMNPFYGEPKYIILHYLGTNANVSTPQNAQGYFSSTVTDCKAGVKFVHSENPDPKKMNTCEKNDKFVQFVVGKNGDIYQLLPETKRSSGASGFNNPEGGISIHIENVGPPMSSAQVNADAKLVKYLMGKYNISKSKVISHKKADELACVRFKNGEIKVISRDPCDPKNHRSDPGQDFMNKVLSKV